MRSRFSGVVINCLDNCSARTTAVIFNVFLKRHKCHQHLFVIFILNICYFLKHQFNMKIDTIVSFPLFSWHFLWCFRGGSDCIQSRATTFHRIRLLPSILFIGIFCHQSYSSEFIQIKYWFTTPTVNEAKW